MKITQALFILIPCAILHSLGMDIFVSGVPEMIRALHTDEQSIQYLLIFFMLGTGAGQPFAGILCDLIGRRRVMLFSAMLFIASSLTAVFVESIFWLTLFRFMAGLGACGTLVATYTVINDRFHGRDAYRIFSFIGCSLALAPMLAPILGVSLIGLFGGWQACFYFLGIFGMIGLAIAYRFLPETISPLTVTPTLGSLKAAYLVMLKNQIFLVYTLTATLALSQLFLYFSVGNILLIEYLGLSKVGFSWVFAFNALIFLLGNYFSTHLQSRMSIHTLVTVATIGMIIGAVSMWYCSQFLGKSVAAVVITNAMMTFGVGMMIGPSTGAALQPFKAFAGVASGLFAVLQYGGAALLGFVVTRFEIHSALSIALPILGLSILTLVLLSFSRAQARSFASLTSV